MEIVLMTTEDIPGIISLAQVTWLHTYSKIISREQIDFMLNGFYSYNKLEQQIKDPAHFFFGVKENGLLLGYSHSYLHGEGLKLSKLYVNPVNQSRGCGMELLLHLEQFAQRKQIPWIELNVNRYNSAQHFYQKMGYDIIEEVDIPLDKFWLNDFVMKKNLRDEN